MIMILLNGINYLLYRDVYLDLIIWSSNLAEITLTDPDHKGHQEHRASAVLSNSSQSSG